MPDDTKGKELFVVPKQRRVQISAQDFHEPGTQGMLFPTPKKGLILFVLFPDVKEQEFRDVLKSSMPSYVIELRTSPRFDIGNLTRREAFHAFKLHNINYCDLTSATMGMVGTDGALASLRVFLREARIKFDKPVVFLVDRSEVNHDLVARVMQTLSDYSPEPKQVFAVPHFEEVSHPRSSLVSL